MREETLSRRSPVPAPSARAPFASSSVVSRSGPKGESGRRLAVDLAMLRRKLISSPEPPRSWATRGRAPPSSRPSCASPRTSERPPPGSPRARRWLTPSSDHGEALDATYEILERTQEEGEGGGTGCAIGRPERRRRRGARRGPVLDPVLRPRRAPRGHRPVCRPGVRPMSGAQSDRQICARTFGTGSKAPPAVRVGPPSCSVSI